MYERGRGLSESEVRHAIPVVGDLRIHDVSENPGGSFRREAVLVVDGDKPLLRPLLDPKVEGMSVLAFGLKGYEQLATKRGAVLVAQEWMVKAV